MIMRIDVYRTQLYIQDETFRNTLLIAAKQPHYSCLTTHMNEISPNREVLSANVFKAFYHHGRTVKAKMIRFIISY